MYRTLATAALLAVLLACTSGGRVEPQPGVDPDGTVTEDDGAVEATTEVEVRGGCTSEPVREDGELALVADVEAVNVGNVGVVGRVVAVWPRAPRARLVAYQEVEVEQGGSVPVELRLPVTRSEVRAVRRAEDNGRECRLRFRVTGAFGAPEE